MGHAHKFFFAITAVAAFGCGARAHAKDSAVVLEPSSQWHLDYANDKCRLSRSFGEGENKVDFQLEQSGPEPYFALAVSGNLARSNNQEIMRIQFGPGEGASERSFITGTIPDTKTPFVVMYGIQLGAVPKDARQGKAEVVDVGPERESAISDVTLDKGLRQPLKLQLESIGEAMRLMRHCVADLVRTIGLDEEGQSRLLRRPVPANEMEFARFLQARYPLRMLHNNVGGTVEVKLTVNPEGKATACQIRKSDRPAAFDDVVCFGLMRMAKFEPALGPDGKPTFAFWSTRVTYRVN
ncbi:MAG: hypothetical protein A3J40_08065 [Erythrobacter sp. RIFCSPHIGHO2_12_FULL_63_10]|nr:MAG: hypothetical protein A3J40_08065 [Erythrobacter sp. RIFCSPHIGHO2_12_FULL_63_10]